MLPLSIVSLLTILISTTYCSPTPKRSAHVIAFAERDSGDIESEIQSLSRKYRARSTIATSTGNDASQRRQLSLGPSNVTIPLTIFDASDNNYSGSVGVGTPAQIIPVAFDTGTTDTLIPLVGCTNCTSPQFDLSKSSTFVPTFNLFNETFNDGTYSTTVQVSDTFGFGTLSVPNTEFLGIYTQTFNAVQGQYSIPTGTISLSYGPGSLTGFDSTFVSLVKAGVLSSHVVSFFLTRGGTAGSEICLGCIDTSKFTGAISYYPLDFSATTGNQTYWTLNSGGFVIGTKKIGKIPSVIVDSILNFLAGTPSYVKSFYAAIPGSKATGTNGIWTYPCDFNSTISLMFGQDLFAINPVDFNKGPFETNATDCIGGLLEFDGLDTITKGDGLVIGTVFMKDWYTVFDYDGKQVGFAPSNNPTGQGV